MSDTQPSLPSVTSYTPPDYVRLAEPPSIEHRAPICSTCSVDLEFDGDCYGCPSCGTSWDTSAGDGDRGELYASWAGEESSGPMVTAAEAWQVSHLKGEERLRRLDDMRKEAARRG